jgi:hypothetical protein
MTETFVATSDALARATLGAFLVEYPGQRRLPRPGYLPDAPSQTATEYAASLAKLGKLGLVKRAD